MTKLLLLLALLAPSFAPAAFADEGFVQLPMGHEVYVDYQAARPGKATFVLVNGLVYNFSRWNPLANRLQKEGYGVLRYYFRGQLDTLRRELKKGEPSFFRDGLSPQVYSQELAELVDRLELKKVVVVGLSYGAGIAADFGERYPQKVEQLNFLAPLVVSLDRYDSAGAWVQWNLSAIKIFWGPIWGQWAYDQYYDWIYRNYMRDRLDQSRIPVEMQDVAEAYKETVFHQVRAMREFDLRQSRFAKLKGRVNMLLASTEEERALRDQFSAWSRFDQAQGSLVYLSPAYHAIPDVQGDWAAQLLMSLLEGNDRLKKGLAYYSNPKDGWAGVQATNANDLEARAMKEPRNAEALMVQVGSPAK